MVVFCILAAITGIAALIGAFSGANTGEGVVAGAIQGANWIGNGISAIGDLMQGKFANAGMQMLGFSDQVISDVEEGTFTAKQGAYLNRVRENAYNSVPNSEFLMGGYAYDDPEAHGVSVGWDLLAVGATLAGGAILSKYGSSIGNFLSKWSIPYLVGSQVGGLRGDIQNLGDNDGSTFITTYRELFGSSGSASRFDREDLDMNTPVGVEVTIEEE
jgi:hypothetical protein